MHFTILCCSTVFISYVKDLCLGIKYFANCFVKVHTCTNVLLEYIDFGINIQNQIAVIINMMTVLLEYLLYQSFGF